MMKWPKKRGSDRGENEKGLRPRTSLCEKNEETLHCVCVVLTPLKGTSLEDGHSRLSCGEVWLETSF